jgi:hypothetical protein
MTASAYASAANIAAALALIGQTYMPNNRQQLLQFAALAFANRNAGGGDPQTNLTNALGGSPLANNDQALLAQNLVLAAIT